MVNAHTYKEPDTVDRKTQHSQYLKKLQEDEDYGTEGGGGGGIGGLLTGAGVANPFDVPSIVPTIFKLVGSAIALNSSGLTEGSFGLIPSGVSSQITSVLGTLATSILGPGVIPTSTTKAPFRRRRRTTTTEAATTSTTVITTEMPVTKDSNLTETGENSTAVVELLSTDFNETTTEPGPTTTEVLFKESSLGELPVYAAAYAPNYVASTTPYPVYANSYLHSMYSAPTTTTIATTTTTTESSTTTTMSTSTTSDPNSYNVALPFDYMEGIGVGTGSGPPPTGINNSLEAIFPPNSTYPPPPFQQTPPEYGGEYEYEEQTEQEEAARARDNSDIPDSLLYT